MQPLPWVGVARVISPDVRYGHPALRSLRASFASASCLSLACKAGEIGTGNPSAWPYKSPRARARGLREQMPSRHPCHPSAADRRHRLSMAESVGRPRHSPPARAGGFYAARTRFWSACLPHLEEHAFVVGATQRPGGDRPDGNPSCQPPFASLGQLLFPARALDHQQPAEGFRNRLEPAK